MILSTEANAQLLFGYFYLLAFLAFIDVIVLFRLIVRRKQEEMALECNGTGDPVKWEIMSRACKVGCVECAPTMLLWRYYKLHTEFQQSPDCT